MTAGCASQFSGIRADRFSANCRLFKNLVLSPQEKKQIVDQLRKAEPLPQYIYEVYREAPDKIQVLALDDSRMKYATGRLYHFKKTDAGWILAPDTPVGYWGTA